MEANNLSDIEFKAMTIRMKMNIETIKKNQPEMKNAVSEMKTIWKE